MISLQIHPERITLFIDDQIQFDSKDEEIYHRALIDPIMHNVEPERILVLGGGDGLACREILKRQCVKSIDVVDISKEVTDLFSENKDLIQLNNNSLNDAKVNVINQDVLEWMRENSKRYDAVIVDLVDPTTEEFKKLYTKEALNGYFSLSDYVVMQSGETIDDIFDKVDEHIMSYAQYIPSFGWWEFAIKCT